MEIHALCRECLSVQSHGVKERAGKAYLRARCNMCRASSMSPEQRTRAIWSGIHGRCHNPKNREYRWYGGRGLKVCPRWSKFENFLADMGAQPFPGASIERVDNEKGYAPENCKWIERRLQSHNQRSNRMLTFGGETKHLSAWARDIGVERRTLANRLNCGWSLEDAFTTPTRKKA